MGAPFEPLVLDLAEVVVVRSGSRLLDEVTLEVREGQRWVVLGPNGAGKTTLLQEKVRDVVLTAAYSVVGRWRETYDPSDVARAESLLKAMGMEAFTERTFGTLSEGERKRVQIAGR